MPPVTYNIRYRKQVASDAAASSNAPVIDEHAKPSDDEIANLHLEDLLYMEGEAQTARLTELLKTYHAEGLCALLDGVASCDVFLMREVPTVDNVAKIPGDAKVVCCVVDKTIYMIERGFSPPRIHGPVLLKEPSIDLFVLLLGYVEKCIEGDEGRSNPLEWPVGSSAFCHQVTTFKDKFAHIFFGTRHFVQNDRAAELASHPMMAAELKQSIPGSNDRDKWDWFRNHHAYLHNAWGELRKIAEEAKNKFFTGENTELGRNFKLLLGAGRESLQVARQTLWSSQERRKIFALIASSFEKTADELQQESQRLDAEIEKAQIAYERKCAELETCRDTLRQDPKFASLEDENICSDWVSTESNPDRLGLLCLLWSLKSWDHQVLMDRLGTLVKGDEGTNFEKGIIQYRTESAFPNLLRYLLSRSNGGSENPVAKYSKDVFTAYMKGFQLYAAHLRAGAAENHYPLNILVQAVFVSLQAALSVAVPKEISDLMQGLLALQPATDIDTDCELWKTFCLPFIENRVYSGVIGTGCREAYADVLSDIDFSVYLNSICNFTKMTLLTDSRGVIVHALFEVYGAELVKLFANLLHQLSGKPLNECQAFIQKKVLEAGYCKSLDAVATHSDQMEDARIEDKLAALEPTDTLAVYQATYREKLLAEQERHRVLAAQAVQRAAEVTRLQSHTLRTLSQEKIDDFAGAGVRLVLKTNGPIRIAEVGCSGKLGKPKDQVIRELVARQDELTAVVDLGDAYYWLDLFKRFEQNVVRIVDEYYIQPYADLNVPIYLTLGNHEWEQWSMGKGGKDRAYAEKCVRLLRAELQRRNVMIEVDGQRIPKFNFPADYYTLTVESTTEKVRVNHVVMDSTTLPRNLLQQDWLERTVDALKAEAATATEFATHNVAVSHHGTESTSARVLKRTEIAGRPYDISEAELGEFESCKLMIFTNSGSVLGSKDERSGEERLRDYVSSRTTLPNAGFIRCGFDGDDQKGAQLFYFSKQANIYIKFRDSKKIQAFNEKFEIAPSIATPSSKDLTVAELRDIARIMGVIPLRGGLPEKDASRNMYDLNRRITDQYEDFFELWLTAHDHYFAAIGKVLRIGGSGATDKRHDHSVVAPGTAFVNSDDFGFAETRYTREQAETKFWAAMESVRCVYTHRVPPTLIATTAVAAGSSTPAAFVPYKVDVPFGLLKKDKGQELFAAVLAALLSHKVADFNVAVKKVMGDILVEDLAAIDQFDSYIQNFLSEIQKKFHGKVKDARYHLAGIILMAVNIVADPEQKAALSKALIAEKEAAAVRSEVVIGGVPPNAAPASAQVAQVEAKDVLAYFKETAYVCLPFEARAASPMAIRAQADEAIERIEKRIDRFNTVHKHFGDAQARVSSFKPALQTQFGAYAAAIKKLAEGRDAAATFLAEKRQKIEVLCHVHAALFKKDFVALRDLLVQLRADNSDLLTQAEEVCRLGLQSGAVPAGLNEQVQTFSEKVAEQLKILVTELEQKDAALKTRLVKPAEAYDAYIFSPKAETSQPTATAQPAAAAASSAAVSVVATTALEQRLTLIAKLKLSLTALIQGFLRDLPQTATPLTNEEKLAAIYLLTYSKIDNANKPIEVLFDAIFKMDKPSRFAIFLAQNANDFVEILHQLDSSELNSVEEEIQRARADRGRVTELFSQVDSVSVEVLKTYFARAREGLTGALDLSTATLRQEISTNLKKEGYLRWVDQQYQALINGPQLPQPAVAALATAR